MEVFSMQFLLIFFILFSFYPQSSQSQTTNKFIPPEPFPIFAWCSLQSRDASLDRLRELKDDGFTYSVFHFSNNEEMLKGLNLAQKVGLKIFIDTPELRNKTEKTVKQFINHPALGGYFLRDEPNAKEFPYLGELATKVQSVDDSHPCFINLFPTYASPEQLGAATYQEHIDQFIEKVPVPFISFDHYPILENSVRLDWYENLEIISKAAQKARKPFWSVVLSVAIQDHYPIAALTHLRLQVFSNLAYGAQGIEYWTYFKPKTDLNPDSEQFYSAPITVDLKRTVVYERVWEMNREINALSGVFKNSEVLSVSHTGNPIPKGTRHIHKLAPPINNLNITGAGAIVSELEKGNKRFLVIVNRELENIVQVSITVDDAERVKRVRKDGSINPLIFKKTLHHIEPGDIAIFMWEKK